MSHFSWGQSFLDINETLLEKYAACADAAEVKEVETQWLDDLEKEYQAKRATGTGDNQEDNWEQGNVNRLQNLNISDDDSGSESQEEEADAEDDEDVEYDRFGNTIPKIPAQVKIPVEPTADNESGEEDDHDEQQEAEKVRQKILHSQPFQNPTPTSKKATSNTNILKTSHDQDLSEEDYQSDDSGINSGEDDIYNALPDDDNNEQGISKNHIKSKSRRKGGATVSAVFSSSYVSAPSHPR